jgi:hypothetical protein
MMEELKATIYNNKKEAIVGAARLLLGSPMWDVDIHGHPRYTVTNVRQF